jgi:ribosomal protein L11 methyltransferase
MLVEAIFQVKLDETDAIGDALIAAGALSVSLEDADQDTANERPLFGEPGLVPLQLGWERSRLIALIDGRENVAKYVAQIITEANALCEFTIPLPEEVRGLDEQDWVAVTQSQFSPLHIGRLWVVPTWHEPPPEAELVIRLDPGMAFGTGSHPTTHLCLQWLEQHLSPGMQVLDYGCGSGILAIAAKKLGAGNTLGLDIDPNAIIAARQNAELNLIEAAFVEASAQINGQIFDLVIANILSNPLKILAPVLISHVQPGGHLVLSGVLERQADEVADVYAKLGVALQVAAELDGWVVLSGRAKPHRSI